MTTNNPTESKKAHRSHFPLVCVLFVILAGAAVAVWYFFLANRHVLTEEEAWAKVGKCQLANLPDSLMEAVEDYLDRFPEGSHALDAENIQRRLDSETDEWNHLLKRNCTLEAVDNFIYAHPDGFFRQQAQQLLDSLAFKHAEAEGSEEALMAYVDQFPSSRFVPLVQRMLNEAQSAKLDADERQQVENVIANHFRLMSENSEEIVTTVAQSLSSYIGKKNSTQEDVLNYMRHVNGRATEKLFETKDYDVKKFVNAGIPIFNVRFSLVETINPDDTAKIEIKTFKGTAILDRSIRLTSLVLE